MDKYKVVCYMKIEQEEDEEGLMSKEEAMEELKHLEFLQPEDRFDIEVV